MLHKIIVEVYVNEDLPDDWSQGLFVNIYKGKGSKNQPVSYRPICLLCHAYKAFAVILLKRLQQWIDARIKEGQEGFRQGRGCRDNLHVLRAAINYALKNHTKLDINFVDFTQAFDTVGHDFIQVALSDHDIPEKYKNLIKAIYNNALGRIKGINGTLSDAFPINRGVLQGDILSPILFILCLNSIWKRTTPGQGWQIPKVPNWLLDELSYADDVASFSTNIENSQTQLQNFSDVAAHTASMRINVPKTVHMTVTPKLSVSSTTESEVIALELPHACDVCERRFPTIAGVSIHKARWCGGVGTGAVRSRRGQKADSIVRKKKRADILATQTKVSLNGEEIANVEQFKYLGGIITGFGSDEEDVETRIQQAVRVFGSLKAYWSDKRLNRKLKIRLFKARILPIVTYGCESWTITRKILKNLRGFAARCFSSIAPTDPSNELNPDPDPPPEPDLEPLDSSLTNYLIDSPPNLIHHTTPNNPRTPLVLRIRKAFAEATREIDIISIVDKHRWKWLGHTLRLGPDRNAHRALHLLDFAPGSLLQHLPVIYRTDSLDIAMSLASDKKMWNETECISLCMQYP